MDALWGIDLGGTKIEGVVLRSIEPLDVACRVRLATEAEMGYAHIVGRIDQLVREMCAETHLARPRMIGIGTPGTVDPGTGLMKNCNTVCLNGSTLPKDVCDALGCEVRIANDANCFALAEATIGAARGYPTVFGVIMGTGVGGGVVVDGKILEGAQGIAGEWGHNVIEPDGEPCYCGRRGCVETAISGPALQKFYMKLTGQNIPLVAIASLARAGTDRAAGQIMKRLFEMFGKALAQVVNIFDPHAVVLGGGVGNIEELFTQGRDELAKNVFNNRLDTELLKPALGDSAGVFGAAMLTRQAD